MHKKVKQELLASTAVCVQVVSSAVSKQGMTFLFISTTVTVSLVKMQLETHLGFYKTNKMGFSTFTEANNNH